MSLRRRLQGHRTVSRVQGPDGYARARCSCGANFKAPDGRFMLYDFRQWESTHDAPDGTISA
jgi:hypothetical protein